MTKDSLGRKGFIVFILSHHSPSGKEIRTESQDRNLEVGIDNETMEECSFLDGSLWLAKPTFL